MREEKTIYLVRHAMPAYPGGRRVCLGQKVDVPLSEEGRRQAQRLSKAFDRYPIEAVYSSPLIRAKETAAQIAGLRCPLRIVEGITELDGGVWDGLPFEVIHARYPDYFVPGAAVPPPPLGESDERGLARMQAAWTTIERQVERCAVVVAHSGVNRVFLCGLCGQPLALKKRIPMDYACVSVLRCKGGIWSVEEAGITLDMWEKR